MRKIEWKASNTEKETKRIGELEFQDNKGEWHNYSILEKSDRILFGGFTNSGYSESGYILKEGFSTDETLQELLSELEVYYNDGASYTSHIIYNDRM